MTVAKTYGPYYSTHGHGRKTHISDGDGSLCGIENHYPDLLFTQSIEYDDIEQQFFNDPDNFGCKRCAKLYRKETKTK